MSYIDKIPPPVKLGIDRYVNDRVQPGEFTQAVLENNLKNAINRAHPDSLDAIKEIVIYCCNKIPANCWGSEEEVRAWLENQDEK